MIIMFTSVLMMMLVSQVCSSPVHLAKPFIHDEINSQAGFPATLSFSIRAFDKDFNVDLFNNVDMLSPVYQEYRQESDDELVESNFTSSFLNVSNHCYYHGSVQNDTFGYVAIDICAGIQGVIVAHDEILYIEPHAATEQPEASLDNMHATIHAITRADLPATMALDGNNSSFCGVHDEDEFEDSVEHERWHAEHDEDEEDEEEEESSESSDEPEQGGLWTIVPSTRTTRVRQKDKIQVLIVNDKTRYRSLGSQTEDSSLAILNLVAAYYRNGGFADPIEIELVGQITNNLQDPYTTKTSGGLVDPSGTYGLLGRFNYYRQRYASFLPSHDVAVLMSGKTFRSNILGLATVYSACMRDKSGVVTSLTPGSSQNVANAVIVAHEIGHTLGMGHDGTNNRCSSRGYIMASYAGTGTTWSSCSQAVGNSYLASASSSCLRT